MGNHARLSASAAHRWMRCHGSVALAERYEDKSSWYAKQGSAAHALAEYCLEAGETDCRKFVGSHTVLCYEDDFNLYPDENVTPDKHDPVDGVYPVDADMADAVQVYLDTVASIREQYEGEVIEGIEVPFEELKGLHPDLGGTGDWHLYQMFGEVVLVDYKHGKGVPVDVEDNEQMLTYLLGLYLKYPEAESFRAVIVQPRCPHEDGQVRQAVYTREQMDSFRDQVLTAAMETSKPDAKLEAGSHCRWCPAVADCPEARSHAAKAAAVDFDEEPPEEPMEIPTDVHELSRLLSWVPYLDSYIKAIQKRGEELLLDGHEVPGYKLVRKKSNRAWREDDDTTLDILYRKLRMAKAKLTKTSLLSPAQVEKLGPKAKKLVQELAHKPEGGLTMAPEDDPREPVTRGVGTDFEEKD